MKLRLYRSYSTQGTNGKLYCGQQLVCYTIELPWVLNKKNVSCIPEGSYVLKERQTAERGRHLHVQDVPNRSWILVHPANDALKETKGCIAPVTKLVGSGLGTSSRLAMEKLQDLLSEEIKSGQKIIIEIQKDIEMNIVARAKAPTPRFFKKLRKIGLMLAAAGGAIIAAPISLPAGIVSLGSYLITGGAVLSAVSQATVDDKERADD